MAREEDSIEAPLWDLSPIFPGFDSPAWSASREKFRSVTAELSRAIEDESSRNGSPSKWLAECIKLYNECSDLYESLFAFAYARFSVNTLDVTAQKEMNGLEIDGLPFKRSIIRFRNSLAEIRGGIGQVLEREPGIEQYRFFVKEQLLLQEKQMSPAEEDIAADLSRAGGDAWTRLQESVSSNISVEWNERTGERKTVIALRALAFSADRAERERAYRKEISAWKSMEIPLAFALNGVKGTATILNKRRSYPSALDRALIQARISRKTLESLVGIMEESLPLFRRYLAAKAKALDLPVLSFYDLFAPVGTQSGKWSFATSRDFIVEQLGSFSDELGAFARRAFDEQWIDARPREGKVGGAYCISFPLARVSRILSNWGGDFSSLTTIGHELGHAYHHEVLKDEPAVLRQYPMTLAETASIFSESIIYSSALEIVPPEQRVTILEDFLQSCTQVIVDILSRFRFETALFERREGGELSPPELCEMMLEAQRGTYGGALNQSELHPYMWAVKGHYYSHELGYYNFPYAFGQLFGLGLHSLYRDEGPSFARRYRKLLAATGRANAEEVTASVGFDIESPDFWRQGMHMIEDRIDQFVSLTEKKP